MKRTVSGGHEREKNESIIQRLRQELRDVEIMKRFRVHATDFTRERVLTWPVVIVVILRGQKVSLQNAVNKFFSAVGEVWRVVTASAYRQARQKVRPELFLHLNTVTCEEYYARYGADQEVVLWQRHRVLGVDGSYLNLPDTAETRREFSVQTNQHEGEEQVQALASILYDLRNDIGLSATLGPKQAEKNLLFGTHLAAMQAGDGVVGDRAYADYSVMAMLRARGCHFVIRFPRQSFAVVNAFWASTAQEREVIVAAPASAWPFVVHRQLPTTLRVRLVKVRLPSGEVEVLGTDLLQAQIYPATELKRVYRWRWQHETYQDRIKNIFELERFSGNSVHTIKQDFYGVLFLATLESILSKPAQAELTAQGQARASRAALQVNRAVSYVPVLDHVVQLLGDAQRSPASTLAEIERLLLTAPTRQRPGRQVPRHTRSAAHRLRFAKYRKRLIA